MSAVDQNFEYLRWKMQKGWEKKGIPTTEEYIKRRDYELSVVQEMNFCDYFLIIEDLISWAKERDIPCGPGRGSGAGSIICYSLNITTLDPIQFGLLFERFLNPSRISMPDLDLDFCKERRAEVIDYARTKYGDDRVAHIITFLTMKLRGSIKDVARVQEIENYIPVSDRIAKSISPKVKTLDEAVAQVPFLQTEKSKYPELFRMANLVSGKTRNAGIHPAGIIVTPEPLTNYMPLHFGSKSKERHLSVTQWDMYDVEETGFLKIDFLGLNTLTIVNKTVRRVNVQRAKEGLPPMDIEDIDLEDPKTLELFSNGLTTGIFQLERKYVQDFCRTMGIRSFMDVSVMNAIIRPGTMDAGTTEEFIARRRGDVAVEYMHDSLSEALSETYGIMVYQEQAMQAARVFAGFTLAEADNLRKAIGKKIASKMAEVKQMFFEKAMALGRTEAECETVFHYIETGQRYSFNKSHAVSYGKITFQAAYLKAHYTTLFMCEILNGELGVCHTDSKIGQYVEEARYLGIRIIPPSIMTSGPFFEVRGDGAIEFGLAFVKNVSVSAAREIEKARGKFNNLTEFLVHTNFSTVRSKAVESMIEAGCLDCFGSNRDELLEKHSKLRKLVDKYKKQQKKKSEGSNLRKELTVQELIWEESEPVEVREVRDKETMLDIEFRETCCYLTESPMAPFQREIREYTNADVADIADGLHASLSKNNNLCIAAMIVEVREHIIKKGKNEGKEMCFVRITKDQRTIDCVLFCDSYERLKHMLSEGKVYLFYGKMDRSFIVDDMKLLSTI
jgi:DNA polymerase-3 subunit alpha